MKFSLRDLCWLITSICVALGSYNLGWSQTYIQERCRGYQIACDDLHIAFKRYGHNSYTTFDEIEWYRGCVIRNPHITMERFHQAHCKSNSFPYRNKYDKYNTEHQPPTGP